LKFYKQSNDKFLRYLLDWWFERYLKRAQGPTQERGVKSELWDRTVLADRVEWTSCQTKAVRREAYAIQARET
jgi:hypothetical protein